MADIRPKGCRHECRYTDDLGIWGDVRRCEHGAIWVATGRSVAGSYYRAFSAWDRLSRWSSPIRYRRAVAALDREVS